MSDGRDRKTVRGFAVLLCVVCLMLSVCCVGASAEKDGDKTVTSFPVYLDGLLTSRGYEIEGEDYISVATLNRVLEKEPEIVRDEDGRSYTITLFGLEPQHEAAVVEMGVSHPGDMRRLAEMVRPTMSLFTIIGHAHLEFLKSREGILAEKSVVNAYLPDDGTVFCSGDDDLLRSMECRQEKITFGLGADCGVHGENVRTLPDGTMACTVTGMGRCFDVTIPAYGDHMVYAALEGAAVGIRFGLSDAEIAAGIADYEAVGHRARRLRTETLTVIDDCYNANPTSTASALRSLCRAEGRKVCILGDMLELGEASARLHYETGALALERGADMVLCQGEAAAEIARGAGERGRYFRTKTELLHTLPELIRPGDTVLVKASRSMRFEEITEALLKL